MDSKALTGREVVEDTEEEEEGNPYGGGQQEGKEYETDQVFISNLAPSVTENDIKDRFGSIGIIKIDRKTGNPKIWIYRNPDGTPKGDATVTYDDPPTAQAAIDWFNGKEFLGNLIKVEFAEKRVPKGGFRGGGGRGGPRGGRGGGGDRRGGRDDGRGGGGGGNQGKMEARAGDWDCPSCGNMNFARRDACNKCQTPRGDGGGDSYGGRSGGGRGWGGGRGGGGRGGPRGGGRGGRGGFGGGGRGGYDRQGARQDRRDRPY